MIATLNASFMDEQRKFAEGFPGVGGMMHAVPVTLFPEMRIYRLATVGVPDERLYAAHWWFGYSPYMALLQLAKLEVRSLRDVARERLAVPREWGNAMNLLVSTSVVQPLAAWSGTPRTARSRKGRTQQYGEAWKPDRSITQLYIPGLRELRPDGTRGPFLDWARVLLPVAVEPLP